jgi:hypothetical protein
MKNYIISLSVILIISLNLKAQNQEFRQPYSTLTQIVTDIPLIEMPHFDISQLLEEDKNEIFLKPFRFAKLFEVELNSVENGVWYQDEDYNIWFLSIKSKNAFSLSLTFNDFELPENSKLFVYNKDKSVIVGALTSANNNENKTLTIQHIPGDEIIVEYVEPENVAFKAKLNISNVSHDYRDIFKIQNDKGSGSCEVNINCEEGNNWQTMKKSVVKFTYNEKKSTYLCTGTLITNTALNSTPYLLTAEHCVHDQEVANSTVFYFNYEAENCTGIYGNENQTMSGATLIATGNVLDFSLLLLSSVPPESYTPYYAGWDVGYEIPAKTYCIHHPAGDLKKISIDEDSPVTGDFDGYTYNSHWQILNWETGTTEGGSSGSPLFNSEQRIVGTLTGGEANCSNSVNDYFQKISFSWNNDTTSAKQLKHWLDPNNTNLESLYSYNPFYGLGLDSPKNFTATVSEVNDVELNWGAPEKEGNFKSDNFESYSDFSLNFGNWTLYDLDLSKTCSTDNFDFKNEGYSGTSVIFNSEATKPSNQSGWEAYSGNKYLACFNSYDDNSSNNDWLITPEINVENDCEISFWAKSVSEKYNLERFKAAISIKGNSVDDFKYISDENFTEVPSQWTKYTYDLSDYKGKTIFFAINIISENSLCLLIDDFNVTDLGLTNSKTTEIEPYPQSLCATKKIKTEIKDTNFENFNKETELTEYEVYRNLTKIATLTNSEFSFTDTNLVTGRYVYYLTAKYDTLNSYPSNQVIVTINTSENKNDKVKLSPNPSQDFINIEFIEDTYIEKYQIYSLSGKKISELEINSENPQQLDIQNFTNGLYILKIITDTDTYVKKFIKY